MYKLTKRISSCVSCKYNFFLLLMGGNLGQSSVIFNINSTKTMNLKIKNRYHQMFCDLNEHLSANCILRFHFLGLYSNVKLKHPRFEQITMSRFFPCNSDITGCIGRFSVQLGVIHL